MPKKSNLKIQQKQSLKPITIEDAKQKIYQLVLEGKNPREISQLPFLIYNKVTRFNPQQIRKIREELEPEITNKNRDPDKAFVFKLFKKGMDPVDIVIKACLSYEFVIKSHKEFLDSQNMPILEKSWLEDMEKMAYSIMKPDPGMDALTHIIYAFDLATDSHLELKNYVYHCSRCHEPITISGKSLEAAEKFLSENWGHTNCL